MSSAVLNLFIAVLIMISCCTSKAKVTLSSSADSLCPGDGVVFTCVTDTGRLIWNINDYSTQAFYSPAALNVPVASDIFIIVLRNITGEDNNIYHSTVTVDHIPITYNNTTIRCSDNINSSEKTIAIESPPSQPLNLTSFSNLSSVTISWVAPLDIPLCVHSYTVTVSSEVGVMVYNTADNRSSMKITDLTSDGNHSVIVAGRDGAGRLGQESEELTFYFRVLLQQTLLPWKIVLGLFVVILFLLAITIGISNVVLRVYQRRLKPKDTRKARGSTSALHVIEKESEQSKRIGIEQKKVGKHEEVINCVEKVISVESNVAYAAVKTCQDTKNTPASISLEPNIAYTAVKAFQDTKPDEENRGTSSEEKHPHDIHEERTISVEPNIAYSAVKTCQDDATKSQSKEVEEIYEVIDNLTDKEQCKS